MGSPPTGSLRLRTRQLSPRPAGIRDRRCAPPALWLDYDRCTRDAVADGSALPDPQRRQQTPEDVGQVARGTSQVRSPREASRARGNVLPSAATAHESVVRSPLPRPSRTLERSGALRMLIGPPVGTSTRRIRSNRNPGLRQFRASRRTPLSPAREWPCGGRKDATREVARRHPCPGPHPPSGSIPRRTNHAMPPAKNAVATNRPTIRSISDASSLVRTDAMRIRLASHTCVGVAPCTQAGQVRSLRREPPGRRLHRSESAGPAARKALGFPRSDRVAVESTVVPRTTSCPAER